MEWKGKLQCKIQLSKEKKKIKGEEEDKPRVMVLGN